ncbi:MAG: LPS export ABC transporter periplasmic protein LptC, partial [Deltaproteobacteria bacterium]|nr:LPS export ABC transporter periplasmic protein LptC [Deltaproteobacteria bacterium]
GLAVLVFIHYKTENTFKVSFDGEKKLEVKIEKIHYSGTKEGRVEWELFADSAKRTKAEDLTIFETLKVIFYAKDGTPYTLNAKEGRLREAAGEIYALGDVTVDSQAGYTLKAQSLKYAIKSKEITSEGPVEITSEAMDMVGTGLRAEIESGRFFLLKNVKATFRDAVI